MRRFIILSVLLALATAVHAGSTYRVGTRVLTVGDSASTTIDLLGEPAYKEPLENEYGAYIGERWQYRRQGRVVTVTIVQGKVNDIQERTR